MIACFDVYYANNEAWAAAIVFEDWADSGVVERYTLKINDVGDYQPGRFYERELAPIVQLIKSIEHPISHYVIDAYCHLTDTQAPGMGVYLYETLPSHAIVIGVAKNRFRDTQHAVEVSRGGSKRPLFVTSIGMDYSSAGKLIASMAGEHRIPTMLKYVDRLSRECETDSSLVQ
jgi:deoxyribonuclease V